MAARKSHHANITLFFYLALLVFASLADASSHLHLNSNHNRLLKKRVPQFLPDPPVKPSPSPSPSRVDASPSTTGTPTLTPTSTPLITGHSTASSDSTSSASSASLSSSGISSIATTASNVTSTAVSTASSTLVSSSTSSSSTTLSSSSARTLTQTATFTGSSSVASAPPQGTGGSSDSKKTTTTVIIVIAASVGGVAIIWTLFRKWKLRRSSRFDERLQPIDWQPPTEGEARQRRPTSMESPFPGAAHSAHGSEHGHGASSDHGHGGRLTPLPEHDFTPLPANPFAAVGTYADLAREHTPRPQMQEAYGTHNPVMTRPAYDVNVPLHHQAGYGGHDGYDYTQYHGAQMRY